MNITRLSWLNLISNKLNTFLSILLMTFGIGIISLILLVNNEIEQRLQRDLSETDMVVGAKGSPLQLILSSVYHIDNPTGNIALEEANRLKKNRLIKWAIPLSFGDAYREFRIVGTNEKYLELYNAEFDQGKMWNAPMEAVIGSNVAVSAELKVGDEFHSSHGLLEGGEVHDDHHFVVTGVLEHSGTVIDNLILTDTESVWKVHHDEEANEHHEEDEHDESHHKEHKDHDDHDHTDDKKEITAMLVKFRNPMGHLRIPRQINETTNMQAAVPAIEVSRLKSLLGVGFQTINGIAFVIMVVSGLSIFIGLYNSLNKRRQEMAFLRVQGASRWQLVQLVLQEGIILTILGVIFGVILSRMVLWSTTYFLDLNSNLGAKFYALLKGEIWLMAVALFIGFLASIIPTIQSYKIDIPKTLSDV